MQGMVAGKEAEEIQDREGRNLHHIYVWYDGSSKHSGGGQASGYAPIIITRRVPVEREIINVYDVF